MCHHDPIRRLCLGPYWEAGCVCVTSTQLGGCVCHQDPIRRRSLLRGRVSVIKAKLLSTQHSSGVGVELALHAVNIVKLAHRLQIVPGRKQTHHNRQTRPV